MGLLSCRKVMTWGHPITSDSSLHFLFQCFDSVIYLEWMSQGILSFVSPINILRVIGKVLSEDWFFLSVSLQPEVNICSPKRECFQCYCRSWWEKIISDRNSLYSRLCWVPSIQLSKRFLILNSQPIGITGCYVLRSALCFTFLEHLLLFLF